MKRRPWRARAWFYRPEWFWHTGKPFWFGDDEYHWRTLVIGWTFTGRIIIALRPFTLAECERLGCDLDPARTYPGWPVNLYDWVDGNADEARRWMHINPA